MHRKIESKCVLFTLHEEGVASSHEVKNGWGDSHDAFLVLGRIQTAVHRHYHLASWLDYRCVKRVYASPGVLEPVHKSQSREELSRGATSPTRHCFTTDGCRCDGEGASGAMSRGSYSTQSRPEPALAGKLAAAIVPLPTCHACRLPHSAFISTSHACNYVPLGQ